MTRYLWLRNLAAWGIVLPLAATFLTSSATQADTSRPEPTVEQIARAKEIYAANCAQCHGAGGNGGVYNSPKAPEDGAVPALTNRPEITAAYVDLVLRTGRMPSLGDPYDSRKRHVAYSEEDREALVKYLSKEFDLKWDVPEVETDPSLASRGQLVYAQNCAHCHGGGAAGGVAGKQAYAPNIVAHDPVAIVEGIRVGPFDMPAFGEDVISDQDATAIASWLQVVHEQEQKTKSPVTGLMDVNPVYAALGVWLMVFVLLGSLIWIGTHPKIRDVNEDKDI